MLYDCATEIESDRVLFHDAMTTQLVVPGARFRGVAPADNDRIFAHRVEPVGSWLVEHEGAIVATGGIGLHYNPPYGDLFMEVDEPFRRRGFGSYLIQELKRACYEMGRIPAARCDVKNAASRATLQKAGLLPCARMLTGVLSAV
jgi:GNAT superfamily N-acetyltransferase